MSDEHVHVLTGAYALNAVGDEERETIERHVQDCMACAEEVRELTATAARLGTAVAAAAPPSMKPQVITWIKTVRQLPPDVEAVSVVPRPASARARYARRLVLAACVAAATAFGGTAAWQFQDAQRAEQRAQQARQETTDMARVLAASDARTVSGSLKGGARATVIVSRGQNTAVFLASGLPDLADGKTYQLWFDNDGRTMKPAGLIGDDGAVVMEGDIGKATGVGVTVEPAGGSPQPTTTPLALMTLPA
ncbi:anti-sigma factor [Streptomyces sp. ISL-96]|uniref:anti-sigma factor n=1 Tax=Streptomyces sp. ISL-96 TaxID=2819191 RepID=UPI001BE8AEFC|nr:anti-sigma factor [Streptomyces sp. ISL-96]MBT2490762.1 anti-sigma factor [Streptomyces sp. ISL-96]